MTEEEFNAHVKAFCLAIGADAVMVSARFASRRRRRRGLLGIGADAVMVSARFGVNNNLTGFYGEERNVLNVAGAAQLSALKVIAQLKPKYYKVFPSPPSRN